MTTLVTLNVSLNILVTTFCITTHESRGCFIKMEYEILIREEEYKLYKIEFQKLINVSLCFLMKNQMNQIVKRKLLERSNTKIQEVKVKKKTCLQKRNTYSQQHKKIL